MPRLALHRVFSSSMVLQAETPRVYGSAPPGSVVSVSVENQAHVVVTSSKNGSWAAQLPPQPASNPAAPGVSITVEANGDTITLRDILFGDLWVCGGQSNMEFSVAEAFDSERIIATADIPGLRLYSVQKNKSSAPLAEPQDLQYPQGWVRSTPKTVCGAEYNNDGYAPPHNTSAYCGPHCGPSAAVHSFARATWGYFSAVCFITGRALLRETGRPQGLIESCWGGSSIESWSDAATLQRCAMPPEPTSAMGGSNFNGMIAPFLMFPIRGVIWYQGEANARRYNRYACQMRSMIEGWRSAWQGSGATENFTFVLHQLSACTYSGDVPGLRWSQQGSVAPWTTLQNTAMTVGLDLYDAESPCANVHIRNKTAVGERMARAALHVSYGKTDLQYTGPVAREVRLDLTGRTLTIEFSGATPPLLFKSIPNQTTEQHYQGIEILETTTGKWTQAFASVTGPSMITVKLPNPRLTRSSTAASVAAVRYAWLPIPNTQLLFDSTVLQPAGLHGLPAPPFWANCSTTTCTLIPPGHLPDSAPPPRPSPSPSSAQCPRPATPSGGKCIFNNNTRFVGTALEQVQVKLNDYEGCCAKCLGNKGCHAAAMSHGPKSADYDFCFLYSHLEKPIHSEGDCPVLAVTLVPK